MIEFKTYKELIEDSLDFIPKIAELKPAIILGVSRSGLIPATIIAQQLCLPLGVLYEDKLFIEGRFVDIDFIKGQHVVIDDSCYGGTTVNYLKNLYPRDIFACIYSNDGSYVDLYYKILPSPRLFEWNIFHHNIMERTMMDMDGVLCLNPPNEDSNEYLTFIEDATPLRLPKKINTLITARLQKYTGIIKDWTTRYGIKYDALITSPFLDHKKRRAWARELGGYGVWKGNIYKESKCELFVESDPIQSRQIQKIANKPVYSFEEKCILQ